MGIGIAKDCSDPDIYDLLHKAIRVTSMNAVCGEFEDEFPAVKIIPKWKLITGFGAG